MVIGSYFGICVAHQFTADAMTHFIAQGDFTPADLANMLNARFELLECYIQRAFDAVDALKV